MITILLGMLLAWVLRPVLLDSLLCVSSGEGLTSVVCVVVCIFFIQQKGNHYEQLATALDKLPNGFPRTRSNVEIHLLQKIFSPKEAFLGSCLQGFMESVDVIAERVGWAVDDTKTTLITMAERAPCVV